MEMIGVDENDNDNEPENASHDNVEEFNEDTFELCLYECGGARLVWRQYKTNKAESKDATQEKVEDFNEDTCYVCAFEFITF